MIQMWIQTHSYSKSHSLQKVALAVKVAWKIGTNIQNGKKIPGNAGYYC